jgi:hypothetical protein
MDARMKIIIAVFLLVIVFYFLQFMLEFLKKKEHFTSSYFDDSENYEDRRSVEHFEEAAPKAAEAAKPAEAPKAPESSENSKPYELRIFILDEIEKLNISDKTIKGNVMEALFSETTMKEMESMSKEQRIAKVKAVYDISNKAAPAAAAPVAKPATTGQGKVQQETKDHFIEESIKSYFSNTVEEPNEPTKKEQYNDGGLQTKVQKASEKLDVVIDNLKEMKGILSGKENYSGPELPKMPKDPFLVEGFENIRGYAYY